MFSTLQNAGFVFFSGSSQEGLEGRAFIQAAYFGKLSQNKNAEVGRVLYKTQRKKG